MRLTKDKDGALVQDFSKPVVVDPVSQLGSTATLAASEVDAVDALEGWRFVRFTPPPGKSDAMDLSVLPQWLEDRLNRDASVPLWFGCYNNVAFGAFDELPLTFQSATTASDPLAPGMHVVGSWADAESGHHWIPGRIEEVSSDVLRATLTKLGKKVLHRPSTLGAQWLRVDFQRGLINRLVREKLSGKPYEPKGQEIEVWSHLSSLRLEELYDALNYSTKSTSPFQTVDGDIHVGQLCYMAVAPEGTRYTRAMRGWRPIGYGPGSLPAACPPSIIKWTPSIRKTYEDTLRTTDAAYYENHRSRTPSPYHDVANGEGGYDGRPTYGTRLVRGVLKMAERDGV